MLEPFSSFSRERTLLQRAGNGTSAHSAAGEAGVFLGPEPAAQGRPNPAADASALAAAADRIAALAQVEAVAVHREPARSGSLGRWPDHLDDRLVAALRSSAIAQPYAHQEIALSALGRGENVVLSTATASGKSLCYQLPILDATLRDASARALMLFPTKALGRDQVESLRAFARALEVVELGVGVYDGDAPPDVRRAARSRAHAVATNPDMLHRGVLPHHDGWARVLSGLRYVVLDELHTYRGLFGSHVGNVLRRLWRLCAHYGSSPQVIACSATIANPAELAESLTGLPFTVVDRSTAPVGERTFIVLNPKVVDPVTGVRRDYLKVTRSVAGILRRARAQTLAFCRTRKAVELLTRYMREEESSGRRQGTAAQSESTVAEAIRGYRGGYLPERRREVERALRDGTARMVASTNALELGIDIGGVDAVLLSGYPGTRAATLQRAGRAGRRGKPSLTVLCLSSAPLDQFVAADPGFLWGQPPEHARVDADNPEVLLPHLRCAVHELAYEIRPTDDVEGAATSDLVAALDYLAESGAVLREEDPDGVVRYLPVGSQSPSEAVDLRGSIEENFSVIDDGTGDILAEVDFEDAPLYVHPGAIYTIEGKTHEVRRLDWEERKAYVRPSTSDYYTEAISKLRVRVMDPGMDDPGSGRDDTASGTGLAHVVRSVPGFKKIRFGTHENIGFGPITLPDLELHTVAVFWRFPDAVAEQMADPVRRSAAVLAAAHAIHHVAAMVLMCDTGDLGTVVTAGHPSSFGQVLASNRRPSTDLVLAAGAVPYIVLYDKHPGGAGLASAVGGLGGAILRRAAAAVAGCGCERGCPTCMGPSSDDAWETERADVVTVLGGMARAVEAGP